MSVHVLYRIYSHEDALLYVGRTANPGVRMRKHAEANKFWNSVAYITCEHYRNGDVLEAAEMQAIAVEEPVYNIQHKPKRTKAQAAAYAERQKQLAELLYEESDYWDEEGDGQDDDESKWFIEVYDPSPPLTPEEFEEGRRCAEFIGNMLRGDKVVRHDC